MELLKEKAYKEYDIRLFHSGQELILRIFKDRNLVPYSYSVSTDTYDALPYKEGDYQDIFQGGREYVDNLLGIR